MKTRIIIKDESSLKTPLEQAEEALAGSSCLLFALLYISSKNENLKHLLNYFVGCLGVVSFVLLVVVLLLLAARPRVPPFKVPKMDFKSYLLAEQVHRCFNSKVIINMLKIAVKSNYGWELPNIEIYLDDNRGNGYIAIENRSNTSVLDTANICEILSGCINKPFVKKYSVTFYELDKTGNYYIYHLEDVETSQRLVINSTSDLKNIAKSTGKHEIRLAKDLAIDFSVINASILAPTRAGKTTLAEYLIQVMKCKGWHVHYFSSKDDVYVKKFHGEGDPEKIIEAFENAVKYVDRVNKFLRRKGMAKYTEANIPDEVFILDEVADLVNWLQTNKQLCKRFEVAINRITSKGKSAGVTVIGLSQRATKDSYLPPLAKTNCSGVVIALGGGARPKELQYLLPGYVDDLPHRAYGVGEGIAYYEFAKEDSKWKKPHYYQTPWMNTKKKENSKS